MSKHDTSFIKILVLLFCLGFIQLTSSGCSKELNRTRDYKSAQQTSLSGIINGVKVLESDLLAKKVFYLSVNSTLIRTPMGYAAKQGSFCSSIALKRDLILTAAHCIESYEPEVLNIIEGVSPWLSPLTPEIWHSVQNVWIHPDYRKYNPQFDLALLRLAQPLPEHAVISIHQDDLQNSNVILAGFGFRATHLQALGDINANTPINQSGELYYITKILTDYAANRPTFSFEKNLSDGVCIGDSGGPALIIDPMTNTVTALGLLSGALEAHKPQLYSELGLNTDLCSDNSVYNNLKHPLIRQWIDQKMNPLPMEQ